MPAARRRVEAAIAAVGRVQNESVSTGTWLHRRVLTGTEHVHVVDEAGARTSATSRYLGKYTR